MKTKCRTLKLSIFITCLSLALLTTFFLIELLICNAKSINLLYNMFLGIFCSSIVVLLINIPEYISSKKVLLNSIYNEIVAIQRTIKTIKFLYTPISNEEIVQYIKECESEKYLKVLKKISGGGKVPKNHYNDILKKIKNNIKSQTSNKNIKQINLLSKEYFNDYERKIKKDYADVILSYNISIDQRLNNLYLLLGDVYYLKNNLKKSRLLYVKLYFPLKTFNDNLENLRKYITENYKKYDSIVLSELFAFQRRYFNVEKVEDERCFKVLIYNSFSYNIDVNLQKLYNAIHDIKEEKIIDKIPVLIKIKQKIKKINL